MKEPRKIIFKGQAVGTYSTDNLTCLQLSQQAVIDAGYLPAPKNDIYINKVFLSHTHLDHICALAWYVDNYFEQLSQGIEIYASEQSISNLKEHFFNNKIWPDFAAIKLPSGQKAITYCAIKEGEQISADGLNIEPFSTLHTEGSFGFIISQQASEQQSSAVLFTSDTYYDERIIKLLNERTQIAQVIADVSFSSAHAELASAAKHLTPALYARIKEQVNREVIFHAFHLKFSHQAVVRKELLELGVLGEYGTLLQNGSVVHLDTAWMREQNAEKLRAYNLHEDQKLETILQCFSNMSKSTNAVTNLQELGRMVRTNIAADRCSVWFIDEAAQEYYTMIADGSGQIRVPFGKGIVGQVIASKKPLLENNPYDNPLFDSTNDRRTGYVTKSILAMPIFNSAQQVIGVFQALNKLTNLDGSFTKADFDYIQIAADYSGRIFEGIRFQEDMIQAQKDLIYSIAEMVESKSEETGNHVKRVGLVSEVIARELGYSEEDVKLIGIGAPTHDIGKIGIPDAILNKPGKLTDEEFKFMQKHSRIGYDMLRRFKGKIMETAAAIAHEHHEKYGGGGYPRGLKGEAIHPFARIVALADVFDALASDRCYKKAWPLEEVENFLKANSGSHFDPKVVDAFFACREEIYRINRELADKFAN